MPFVFAGSQYEKNKYGMWHQVDAQPFDYSQEYLQKQATTPEMSWLRIGILLSFIPDLKNKVCLELGPGKGVFFDIFKKIVKKLEGYDVVSSPYSTVKDTSGKWDLLLAYDVLEHFQNIDSLWNIDFRYAALTLPERPKEMFPEWRHRKPGEHRWHLRREELVLWAEDHGCKILFSGSPEDIIRLPWGDCSNTITVLLHRA